MKQIRKGVFETNSSSTHSICIAKEGECTIPDKIYFRFGEFGWESDTLRTVDEKASYLYTGLINNDRQSDFENIVSILKNHNIEVDFEAGNGGYVDHSGNLYNFLNDICSDEGKLIRYLFSDLSFIITGNDNNNDDISINVNYKYDEYFKGN